MKTTAIEFLQKAKAICRSMPNVGNPCKDCPINDYCIPADVTDEADLVRKVMSYQIEEGSDD